MPLESKMPVYVKPKGPGSLLLTVTVLWSISRLCKSFTDNQLVVAQATGISNIFGPSHVIAVNNFANMIALINIAGNLSYIFAVLFALLLVFRIVGWTRTLLRNLSALNVSGVKIKEWYTYFFFVPVVNFFLSIFIFQEIWKASDPDRLDAESWKDAPASIAIYVWYGCWLAAQLLGGPYKHFGGTASFVAECCSCIIDILVAVMAIKLIGRINDRQDNKHALADPLWPICDVYARVGWKIVEQEAQKRNLTEEQLREETLKRGVEIRYLLKHLSDGP